VEPKNFIKEGNSLNNSIKVSQEISVKKVLPLIGQPLQIIERQVLINKEGEPQTWMTKQVIKTLLQWTEAGAAIKDQ